MDTKACSLRKQSFGVSHLSIVDKFGIWLSRRAIKKATKGKLGLKVLELGCGYNALNLVGLRDIASLLVGVDFKLSSELQNYSQFISIESSIEEALPGLADHKFDLIMLVSVLEHLSDPCKVLAACKNLLTPEGVLIINVPTWAGKFFLEYSAFKLGLSPADEMDDHKMYYDKRDLWHLLVKAGFLPSKIELKYHKFYLNLFAILRAR